MSRQLNGHTPHQQSPLARRSSPGTVSFAVDPYASEDDAASSEGYVDDDQPQEGDLDLDDEDEDRDDEPKEIWSSILRGVAASKASLPIKNVIVLGDSKAGKQTIINALRQHTENPDDTHNESGSHLALSYSYMEVTEDDSEDVVARVGLYNLSNDAAYQGLLRFALNLETLADSLVVLVLDWTRPWTFFDSLDRWLTLLERTIGSMSEQRRRLVEELRGKLESYIRDYVEPVEPGQEGGGAAPGTPGRGEPSTPVGASASQVVLPLARGTLTNNLGIPVVVVAAKSDATINLERERDYKEDQFDFIQQSLRTVCLKYGAALFYTSIHRSQTLSNLRSYILHRLIGTPASYSSAVSSVGGQQSLVVTPSSFAFNLRARVLDRDTVLVPSGWDSWGKIRVLREGFDCEGMAGLEEEEGEGGRRGGYGGSVLAGPKMIYEEVIRNPQSSKPLPINATITAEDEETFLERHLEILSVSVLGSFTPSILSPGGAGSNSGLVPPGDGEGGAGVPHRRGPASVSSIASSTEMMEDVSAKLARLTKMKDPSSLSAAREKLKLGTELPLPPTLSAATSVSSLHDTDPRRVNPVSSITPQQNEVLANFFQSLLAKKGQVAAVVGSGGGAAASAAANGNGAATAAAAGGLAGANGKAGAGANGSVGRERSNSGGSNATETA
ncbi:hypothetical protein HDV00_001568 [Rhizophlyctis rosea]|nr:hypothetical protein HDV00_001568 [Rhizophlyctis rosea]